MPPPPFLHNVFHLFLTQQQHFNSICQVLDLSCMFDQGCGSVWYVGVLRRSVAILLPEVPILVATFELSVASLSRQIVVMNSALKSISGARRQLVKEFFSPFAFCTKLNNISRPTSRYCPRNRWWRSISGVCGRRWGGMSEGLPPVTAIASGLQCRAERCATLRASQRRFCKWPRPWACCNPVSQTPHTHGWRICYLLLLELNFFAIFAAFWKRNEKQTLSRRKRLTL